MRISEVEKSLIQYENDIVVFRDRIKDFVRLRNNIQLKIKSIKQNIKIKKHNGVTCDISKTDLHRASYSRHLKNKKPLENIHQNKVNIPRKNPIKRVVKEEIKVFDIDTKVGIQFYFTDIILKIPYDIDKNNHHDKHANSIITITSKFDNVGINKIHIFKIMEEKSRVYAKLINKYKFKYKLNFLLLFNKYGEDIDITSEIKLPITFGITRNLTQSDIDIINIHWTIEKRIKGIEKKVAGWNFQRTNTLGISF